MKTPLLLVLLCALCGLAAGQTLIPMLTPPPPPPGEVVASALIEGVNAGLADRVARLRNLWETLWENPRATPAEVLEALDTRAVRIFQAAGAAIEDLERMAELAGTTPQALLGDAKYLNPKLPVTYHPDGRVTLK